MKWKKSKIGGCYTVIGDVINIEVYRSVANGNRWIYSVFQRRSRESFKTMSVAKIAAVEGCRIIIRKALKDLEEGGAA